MSLTTPPERIAFCITDLDAGGAERALVQIVTRLDRRRFEPSVFCLSREGELAAVLREAGIPVVCLGAAKLSAVSAVWRLSRELRRARPAILQTFLYHANLIGRLAGKAAGVPHIVSGIRVAEKRSQLRLWLDRATDRLVKRHVCVSRDVAAFSESRGRLPPSKIAVIPNGVDAELFATAPAADLGEFEIPEGSRTLLFVGRLDPQKGPCVLLEAAKRLFNRYPDLHLLFVGDGPLREKLRASAETERGSARVHFAGIRRDVPSLMRAASVFVLPSLWEGLPNVVLEAMAAGIPIVVSRVEGIGDLWGETPLGIVAEPNSVESLAAAIENVLQDFKSARQRAIKAQVLLQQRFTWDDAARQYERLYAALLEGAA